MRSELPGAKLRRQSSMRTAASVACCKQTAVSRSYGTIGAATIDTPRSPNHEHPLPQHNTQLKNNPTCSKLGSRKARAAARRPSTAPSLLPLLTSPGAAAAAASGSSCSEGAWSLRVQLAKHHATHAASQQRTDRCAEENTTTHGQPCKSALPVSSWRAATFPAPTIAPLDHLPAPTWLMMLANRRSN